MKTSIKFFCAMLLLFAFLLSACGAVVPSEESVEPPRTDEVTTEATQAPTTEAPTTEGATVPAETEPITRENVVTEAHRDVYTWTDGSEYLHVFPKINLPGEYAEEINTKFQKWYDKQQKKDGVLQLACDCSYEFYVFEDILTVVYRESTPEAIHVEDGFDIADEYRVYQLHISDGSPVTTEEILRLAGVTEEDFYQRVAVGTGNAFCVDMASFLARVFSPDDPAAPAAAVPWFNDTIGEDYVHQAVPYLKDDGTLWFAGYVRQVAGASYFMVLLPYEQTEELSPYYEPMLELSPEFEGTT